MKNVIDNILERMLLQFDIKIINDEYYYYKDYKVVKLISRLPLNKPTVLNLLDLPEDIYFNIEYATHKIASSKYFTRSIIRKDKASIRPFLDVLSASNIKVARNTKTKYNAVKCFKKQLNWDVSDMMSFDLNKDQVNIIKSKLNGKLVKDWLNYNPKNKINTDELIDAYKKFLRMRDIQFIGHLLWKSHKEIKDSFLLYYMLKEKPRAMYKDKPFDYD